MTAPSLTSPTTVQKTVNRIAVGVDGHPEGRDAVALGAAIAEATGADLMLVSVHSAPLLPAPGLDWKTMRKHAERDLRVVRNALAPDARTKTKTDASVPRGLQRVARSCNCDLLVMGSSREAEQGHVRIGKRTRQLLCNFESALAVAPRGIHERTPVSLKRIGVGYDGGPESEAALELAGALAGDQGELSIQVVVDDRVPLLLRSALGGLVKTEWNDVISEEEQRLQDDALAAGRRTGAAINVEVSRGRPADALLALSRDVDLIVIGSRRWGPTTRVLLGSTGEALMHNAACPIVAVPRPSESD